jgi:hypothetical protein
LADGGTGPRRMARPRDSRRKMLAMSQKGPLILASRLWPLAKQVQQPLRDIFQNITKPIF